MKISCKSSHTGFVGSGFKSLFYGTSPTQDTVQDMADSGTAKCVCRGCMWPQSNIDAYKDLATQIKPNFGFFSTLITKMPILLG